MIEGRRRLKIASLSCPDLIIRDQDYRDLFQLDSVNLKIREDSDGIVGWHKASNIITTGVRDTWDLFSKLGHSLDCFDIYPGRGHEILLDLSDPVPEAYHNQYDIVFDCISNQCFNFPQVLKNIVSMLKVGGQVLHHIPVVATNQGFYSIGPVLFQDFYSENHFDIVQHQVIEGIYTEKSILQVDVKSRLKNLPDDAMNLVTAMKTEVRDVCSPVMSKFKKRPDCKLTTKRRIPHAK
jgi:hypothetical protein